MATSLAGLCTLHAPSESCIASRVCVFRPRAVSIACLEKKASLYLCRTSPFLWQITLSRRAFTCNFFRHSVEEESSKDQNNIEQTKQNKVEENGEVKDDRPPFDLNLAIVLAGFAFEAYTTPPENAGVHEIDAGDCETVFLSEHFLHEVYDGQLFVKLKKGVNLPAMDPWGTSDPYIVMQLGDCIVKSKTIWATKEPSWKESFIINVKEPSTKYLQVAAWDANLVTPHKRMGNAGVKLESLCDGKMHEIQVELEGIGGGGLIHLELNYKTFEEISAEKDGWRIPFLPDIPLAKGLENTLKTVFGTESVKARDFVLSAFGQIQPVIEIKKSEKNNNFEGNFQNKESSESILSELNLNRENKEPERQSTSLQTNGDAGFSNQMEVFKEKSADDDKGILELTNSVIHSEFDFWKSLAGNINPAVERLGINKVDFPVLDNIWWTGNEMIKNLGLQSQTQAEEQYVESGLATPKQERDEEHPITSTEAQELHPEPVDVKQASHDILRQTETILTSLMMLTTSLTGHKRDVNKAEGKENTSLATDTMPEPKRDVNKAEGKENTSLATDTMPEPPSSSKDGLDSAETPLTNGKPTEMKRMFATAESAMEAWAMLATSLGCTSFIKSEFEKICFLDNRRTDTQVAVWRDASRQRLVIAFRGTEQVRWKDLRTDLMLAPAGLNPERVGGDFKEEVQVHSGFLSAYDSVRNRLHSFIKTSIGFMDGEKDKSSTWHVYVTGHSLGGALATLLALELSSSQMAKHGYIKITMYNFGSPRVGNKRFAEEYNKKVKDSWRIVNHRDIIPTVPRLMGYCHVAQAIYLAAEDLQNLRENMQVSEDEYQGDVIGESTPDTLFNEFMKGEKQLIDKLVQTEINLFRAIRDGTALMQHMEDFYYITLLQCVRSRILQR